MAEDKKSASGLPAASLMSARYRASAGEGVFGEISGSVYGVRCDGRPVAYEFYCAEDGDHYVDYDYRRYEDKERYSAVPLYLVGDSLGDMADSSVWSLFMGIGIGAVGASFIWLGLHLFLETCWF